MPTTRRRIGRGGRGWVAAVAAAASAFAAPASAEAPFPPDDAGLRRLLRDEQAPTADRQRALEEIRARKVAAAIPDLRRVAVTPRYQEGAGDRHFRVGAMLALFELGDPKVRAAAERVVTRGNPGVDDPRDELLMALGGLADAASFEVLKGALGSRNPYVGQHAALGLARRPEPEAEAVLVEAMLSPRTCGYVAGIIRYQMIQRGSPGGARGLLGWAAGRRDIRDDVAAALHGWLRARPDATMTALRELARDPDPGVARLAAGFLDRQPLTVTTCGLPGAPAEGEARDGAAHLAVEKAWREFVWQGAEHEGPPPQNLFVRIRAKTPLYPYALAFRGRARARRPLPWTGGAEPPLVQDCYRLSPGFGFPDRQGRVSPPWLPAGATALIGTTPGQSYGLMYGPIDCWTRTPVGEHEGELLFFVGEDKYRLRFPIEPAKVPPGGPPPVP